MNKIEIYRKIKEAILKGFDLGNMYDSNFIIDGDMVKWTTKTNILNTEGKIIVGNSRFESTKSILNKI